MDYYVREGKLDLRRTKLPKIHKKYAKNHLSKWCLKLHIEMTLWNDCFFRNMNLYEYIAIIDVDEVAVPKSGPTWQDMSRQFLQNMTNYVLTAQIFEPTGTANKWIVESERRAVQATNMSGNAKSMVSTDRAWYINDHHRSGYCLNNVVKGSQMLDLQHGQLNHYREGMNLVIPCFLKGIFK